jgi:hypothetical protein
VSAHAGNVILGSKLKNGLRLPSFSQSLTQGEPKHQDQQQKRKPYSLFVFPSYVEEKCDRANLL